MSINDFFNIGFVGSLLKNSQPNQTLTIVAIAIAAVICIIAPYLLGSLNFAIIISKTKYKSDIRNYGSGNAGATNMMRTFGKSAAGLTFLGDALKAFVSGLLGYALLGALGAYIAGIFCILGHMFPLYYKFKGGKGVVTAAISILMCNPIVFVILLLIFVIIVAGTKYISLGSVMCVLMYPFILNAMDLWLNKTPSPFVLFALFTSALVIFMHRENIKRLLAGKENKFSFKKSEKPTDKNKDSKN